MNRLTFGSALAVAVLLGSTPDLGAAQQVAVDAHVRVSPQVVIGVRYGEPVAVPVRVERVPRRRVVHRVVDVRALERAHRRWHERAARAHHRLAYDLEHGYVSAREHAAWHRRMAREHDDLFGDLNRRDDWGWGRGR